MSIGVPDCVKLASCCLRLSFRVRFWPAVRRRFEEAHENSTRLRCCTVASSDSESTVLMWRTDVGGASDDGVTDDDVDSASMTVYDACVIAIGSLMSIGCNAGTNDDSVDV